LGAVSGDGMFLKHVLFRYKDCREVVAAAVKQNPQSIICASRNMMLHQDFILLTKKHFGSPKANYLGSFIKQLNDRIRQYKKEGRI
jgi:hypothetical protein